MTTGSEGSWEDVANCGYIYIYIYKQIVLPSVHNGINYLPIEIMSMSRAWDTLTVMGRNDQILDSAASLFIARQISLARRPGEAHGKSRQ
jgi:hypothetical protein